MDYTRYKKTKCRCQNEARGGKDPQYVQPWLIV